MLYKYISMTVEQCIFYIYLIWYFYKYGPPHTIHYFLVNTYFLFDESIIKLKKIMYPDYSEVSSKTSSENSVEINNVSTHEPKYENKYLDIIRQISKEWQFTEDEMKEKNNREIELLNNITENIKKRIEEIATIIFELEKEIKNDSDTVMYTENFNEEGDELVEETTLEERNEYRKNQINQLLEESNKLTNQIESDDGLNNIKNEVQQEANNFIIDNRIDKLKNCYVMEKTPQGNVLMFYNKEKNSFTYYSDSTIPYRYLEVVGRKYVKILNCRPLFVDMDEELKLFEEKWTKDYELKKAKENQKKINIEESVKNNNHNEDKKNIFAKFKNYNKNNGVKISMAAPPKNSIPSKMIETKEDEKILLKERANRYTYEGKMANFNFLQKIERKVFNKKLGVSFADFKKMKQN